MAEAGVDRGGDGGDGGSGTFSLKAMRTNPYIHMCR